jgi:hypothetical protein
MGVAARRSSPTGGAGVALIFALLGATGLVLLGGAVAALLQDRTSAADFGTVPPSPRAAAPAVTGAAPTAEAPSPTAAQPPGRRASPGRPVRIRIPGLHVDAPVVQVAVSAGSLGVPVDPATVGWWSQSALAGSPAGAVVIDGHVDSATRGLGALFRLTALRRLDLITVITAGGGAVDYRVSARHTYPKSVGLPADLFLDPAPKLVVITCGGPFDKTTLSYEDNVVVVATPATTT